MIYQSKKEKEYVEGIMERIENSGGENIEFFVSRNDEKKLAQFFLDGEIEDE